MSIRKSAALLGTVFVATTLAHSARADLLWEHTATFRTSRSPKSLAQVKMYNTWTPTRHRLLLKYTASPEAAREMGGVPFSESGQLGIVQRLDDDRVLAYDSQTKQFISHPRLNLLQRLRFNPWKSLAPKLANQNPPELTSEQRKRLVDEVGALSEPFRRNLVKTYFRALPQLRTFNGIEGRGYRLTQLINSGGSKKNQSWVRVSVEYYLSSQLAGDSAAEQFNAQVREGRRRIGPWTNSMWLNEMFALSQIPTDPNLRRAYALLQVPANAPAGAFVGTPLFLSMRVTPPALQRAQTGDILMELKLTQRTTTDLLPTVFDAPSGYKRYDIEPALKQIDPVMDGRAWEKSIDAAMSLVR